MSTRAIVARSAPEGTWTGVWNHCSGQTQHLGRWIIREIGKREGDLEGFCRDVIDACPEGWSDLARGVRTDDPVGPLAGRFDGVVATCDESSNELVFDAHYLYLIHPPKRRLYVFVIDEGTMRPFGMITFDVAGAPTPKALPKVEE